MIRKIHELIYTEMLKIYRSKVFITTMAVLSLAPIMGSLFVIVLRSSVLSNGNKSFLAKASLVGFSANWPSFINLLIQAIGVGGLLVFGFAASWVFGREYSDRTLKDLLVLPVSRNLIVLAKMIAVFLWCITLAVEILVLGLLMGFLLDLPGWSMEELYNSGIRYLITTLLVIFLNTPVTFIASVGKGYMAPLGFVVSSLVLAQIIGALGLGSYFPWAVPAIYSKIIGTQSALNSISFLLLGFTSLFGFLGTIFWWNYKDQTK